MSGLAYDEQPPRRDLQRAVRFIWTLRGPAEDGPPQLIVPDGCMEIVLNAGEPVEQLRPDGPKLQPRFMLVGELRRPVWIRPSGTLDMLGARLEAGGAAVLFGESAERFADTMTDLASVASGAELTGILTGGSERKELFEAWLLARLRASDVDDRLVRHAVKLLAASRGMMRMEDLAEELEVGARALERAFKRLVGVSPKAFSQLTRFRALLDAATSAEQRDWAELAAACGYYDQAHLIRDFKTFTGQTPRVHLGEEHPLNFIFSDPRGRA
jgi:AraC-like DNA-binding protein